MSAEVVEFIRFGAALHEKDCHRPLDEFIPNCARPIASCVQSRAVSRLEAAGRPSPEYVDNEGPSHSASNADAEPQGCYDLVWPRSRRYPGHRRWHVCLACRGSATAIKTGGRHKGITLRSEATHQPASCQMLFEGLNGWRCPSAIPSAPAVLSQAAGVLISDIGSPMIR